MIRYLSAEEVVAIHRRVLEETGGHEGIHDAGLLFSASEKPKASFGGKEMYPDLFTKASVLLEALANYHTFSDGNKRTAYLAAKTFLAINGFRLKMGAKEGLVFMLSVANKQASREKITLWLKKHSKSI
ncbi:TPA: type II toxin-antitoxin system death-on-curing family toxin [Candidatus Uhrbacteria bacterium]|uniref:Death-on-curing family protein n=1 Tax=Candidatus Uhrbacteria bacterium GW2011_GWC2_53_7 TaxID=1618986 RepID=A0A0G1Y1B3_9BACT|nr:MAG: death-on-curing family protein [Candidatus Uhrbacteria bacterium GW2011_GWC2_53_7]HBL39934.1 type II toxin-antitoxin system death-on-curing family toxin [Candidatus Uhrbacteria bacterium]